MAGGLIWVGAKCFGVIIGAYAGYVAGTRFAYFAVEHGDVGSAALAVLTIPVGMIAGISLGYLGLQRIERRNERK